MVDLYQAGARSHDPMVDVQARLRALSLLKEALPLREPSRDLGRCVASSSSSDFVTQLDLAGVCRTRAVNWRRSQLADLFCLPFPLMGVHSEADYASVDVSEIAMG